MLLLVADENFNNDILRGLLRRDPSLDIVRIQDVGLTKAPDRSFWNGQLRKTEFCSPMIATQSPNLPTNALRMGNPCQA